MCLFMNVKEIRAANVQRLIDDVFNGNSASLAKTLGKQPSYVYRWFSKAKHARTISDETAEMIEKICNKDKGWLDRIHDNNVQESSTPYSAIRRLPLISWVEAGAWHEASDPFEPGDYEDAFPCPAKHGIHAYALRVKGDSMTSPYGRSYPEGMIIFVDPEKQADNGDRVIAKVNGDNAVTFKQLVIDGDRKFLKPLNPAYPVITDPFSVLGKVIGAYMEE